MVVWESHANVSREVAGLQEVWGGNDITVRATGVKLQEIPQLIIIYGI